MAITDVDVQGVAEYERENIPGGIPPIRDSDPPLRPGEGFLLSLRRFEGADLSRGKEKERDGRGG